MNRHLIQVKFDSASAPRVSGDEPVSRKFSVTASECSPRERG